MRTLFRTSLIIALLLFGSFITAQAQPGKLQLDQLDALANRASNTVDVKFDENLIKKTGSIFTDKDDAEIRELLKSLKGVYVKSFNFDKENEYSSADVESVMSQLRSGGWSKIVGVTSKKEGENVEVYLLTITDQIQGLAVVTQEPKQFMVINIVGPVNLEKLSQLEGSFGVPDLNLPKKPKKDKDDQ